MIRFFEITEMQLWNLWNR